MKAFAAQFVASVANSDEPDVDVAEAKFGTATAANHLPEDETTLVEDSVSEKEA